MVRADIGLGAGAVVLVDVHLQAECLDLELQHIDVLQDMLEDDLQPVPRQHHLLAMLSDLKVGGGRWVAEYLPLVKKPRPTMESNNSFDLAKSKHQ